MTGRDLIVYILQNRLEDEVIYDDRGIMYFDRIGLMTSSELAKRMEVGTETVNVWCKTGCIDCIKIEGSYYIVKNSEKTRNFTKLYYDKCLHKGGSDA